MSTYAQVCSQLQLWAGEVSNLLNNLGMDSSEYINRLDENRSKILKYRETLRAKYVYVAGGSELQCPETFEQIKAKLNLDFKMPLPKILQLRQNKVLTIKRTSYPAGYTWSKEKELDLRKSVETMAAQIWAKTRDAKNSSDAIHIKGQRDKRRRSSVRYYSYTFERGPYNETGKVEAGQWPQVRNIYNALTRKISHERKRLRFCPTLRSGQHSDLIGGVRSVPGGIVKIIRDRKKEPMFQDNAPRDGQKHIGLELEFCSKWSKEKLSDALFDAGLLPHVTLKDDGSVTQSGDRRKEHPHELCILTTEADYAPLVDRVCAVLNRAQAYVNKSCGMHVHLDMRSREPKRCYKRLLCSLDILYELVPPVRRYNKYCLHNDPEDSFVATPLPPGGRESRYAAVNTYSYAKHQTLEIRLHGGTTNPNKIKKWVELLLLILNTNNSVEYRALPEFIAAFKVPDELASYMLDRQALFKKSGVHEDDEYKKLARAREDGLEPTTTQGRRCLCNSCSPAPNMRVPGDYPDGVYCNDSDDENEGEEESA